MVDHIYGRLNILNDACRPNMFIKELKLNIEFFIKDAKNPCLPHAKADGLPRRVSRESLNGIRNTGLSEDAGGKKLYRGRTLNELKSRAN